MVADSRYAHAVTRLNTAFADVVRGTDEKALRRIARDVYPWGERKHHPYKMWLKATNDVVRERLALERWTGSQEDADALDD